MASVQFRIHTDMENAKSSTGLKMGRENPQQGGKSFQAHSHKTPRRALGSVNEADRVGLGGKVQDKKSSTSGSVSAKGLKQRNVNEVDSKLKNQQPVKKDNIARKGKHQSEENPPVPTVHCKQQPSFSSYGYSLPDIEYMPPRSPPRDEDEDILPLRDRASTYVNKLLSWRPQCLFGLEPDSDEEEEERERQRIMDELDNLPMLADDLLPEANLHLSIEVLDLDDLELPAMDDAIPFMDDDDAALQDHWINVSIDVSLPELDDSLGLAGTLELRNQSLPSTPVTPHH